MSEVNQRQLTYAEAEELTAEIVKTSARFRELILKAYEGRAWIALGFPSWADYCAGPLGGVRPDLPREDRRELVGDLRDMGMSQRAIGSAVGAAKGTIQNDLRENEKSSQSGGQFCPHETPPMSAMSQPPLFQAPGSPTSSAPMPPPAPPTAPPAPPEPSRVTGTDGKAYAASQPQPSPPTWSAEEFALRQAVEHGGTVVATMREKRHAQLITWAKEQGLFVRIDRKSDWGNPFEIPGDGDRATVIRNHEHHYLAHKPSLLSRLVELRGKVLGCWCAPEPCHGDTLKRKAEEL